jgi:hypothetical protein
VARQTPTDIFTTNLMRSARPSPLVYGNRTTRSIPSSRLLLPSRSILSFRPLFVTLAQAGSRSCSDRAVGHPHPTASLFFVLHPTGGFSRFGRKIKCAKKKCVETKPNYSNRSAREISCGTVTSEENGANSNWVCFRTQISLHGGRGRPPRPATAGGRSIQEDFRKFEASDRGAPGSWGL